MGTPDFTILLFIALLLKSTFAGCISLEGKNYLGHGKINLNKIGGADAPAASKQKTSSCRVNVCFALDGGGSIIEPDFRAMKNIVTEFSQLVANKSPASQFAATQFSLVNDDISKLTSDAASFLSDVASADFANGAGSFILAGLGFCLAQLDDASLPGDVRKIVLVSNGKENIGNSPLLLQRILDWRDNSPSNSICAVAAGIPDLGELNRFTGDPKLLFSLKDPDAAAKLAKAVVEQFGEECLTLASPAIPPSVTRTPSVSVSPSSSGVDTQCPCECFDRRDKMKNRSKARNQCSRERFSNCSVSGCGSNGFSCCM